MLVIIGKATAAEGQIARLLELGARVASATRQDEGCLDYGFYVDVEDPNVMVGVEIWRDQAALDAHMEHDHTTTFLQAINGLFADDPTMTFLAAEPVGADGKVS